MSLRWSKRARRYCAATGATLIVLASVSISVATTGCSALETKERELLFRPVKEAAGWYNGTPSSVQEVWLPVGDGTPAERIHAWWWPADDPGAPAVLYLHGVRWNLTGHLNRMSQLRRFGFSVFAIDYRGFGKSDGELPSETTVYEDARAAWKWLVAKEPDFERLREANAERVEQLAILGQRFSSFLEEQFCWFLETFRFLKGRSRVISLADYTVEKRLVLAVPHRMLLGEPDEFEPEPPPKALPTPRKRRPRDCPF